MRQSQLRRSYLVAAVCAGALALIVGCHRAPTQTVSATDGAPSSAKGPGASKKIAPVDSLPPPPK